MAKLIITQLVVLSFLPSYHHRTLLTPPFTGLQSRGLSIVTRRFHHMK